MELILTKAETVNRRRVRIWLNDEPAFCLPPEEFRKLKLQEGEAVDVQTLAQIHEQVLGPLAQKRCLDILVRGDRSRKELFDRLMRDEYPEDVARLAVEYAQGFHYVDDLRLAISYIERYAGQKSERELRFKLRGRGVPDEVISQAFEEAGTPDAGEQIRQWARKKHFDWEQSDAKERDRFMRFLAGKGYSLSDIKKTLT